MVIFLKALGVSNKELLKLAMQIPSYCKGCAKFRRPKHKPQLRITLSTRFNERVQLDLFYCWDET